MFLGLRPIDGKDTRKYRCDLMHTLVDIRYCSFETSL